MFSVKPGSLARRGGVVAGNEERAAGFGELVGDQQRSGIGGDGGLLAGPRAGHKDQRILPAGKRGSEQAEPNQKNGCKTVQGGGIISRKQQLGKPISHINFKLQIGCHDHCYWLARGFMFRIRSWGGLQ